VDSQNEPQQERPMTPSGGESVHFLDYWQILFSRKEIVVAVTLLMLLIGIIITRAMPDVYAATTLIQVKRVALAGEIAGSQYQAYDPVFLKTQFEIIRSTPIIETVVRELNLHEKFGRAYGYSEQEVGQERTVQLVQRKLSLELFRDTDLIAITFKFDKPNQERNQAAYLAVDAANTLATVFQTWILNQNRQPRTEAMDVVQRELDMQDSAIAKESLRLTEVREKYGIVISNEGGSGAEAIRHEISTLFVRQSQAMLDRDLRATRYEMIRDLPDMELAYALSSLTGDASVEPLLAEKSSLEVDLGTLLRSLLGEKHPKVITLRMRLDEIEKKIVERVNVVRMKLRFDYERALTELDTITERFEAVKAQELMMSSGSVMEYHTAREELSKLQSRRDLWAGRLMDEKMKLVIPATSVNIIDQAKKLERHRIVSPNIPLNITLSLIAGLFFGVVLAFLVEYMDTSIKTVDDVEKFLNLTVLGLVPQKVRHLNDASARVIHSEPYRVMRTNIKSSKRLNATSKIINVTSASAGEGKSLTVFNLAYVCAECGDKTLIVDSDLHRPRQHKIVQMDNVPGLCNVLVGEANVEHAIVNTVHPNLDLLPSGRLPGASVHGLLDTEEMTRLLQELRSRYDRIILDSPPMIGLSDSAQLVRIVDGTVLVVQHRKYPRFMAKRTRDIILGMGGSLVGVVLNNINIARDYSSYYYKQQYYYYPYAYASAAEGEAGSES